ncbi:hypothetical protein ACLKA7_000173 [Drosophila subpalustris]
MPCRKEERRRNLAELRIAYGNALSDSNLGRSVTPVTPVTAVTAVTTSVPFGQLANSYSWQLSNTCSGQLMQKASIAAVIDKHLPIDRQRQGNPDAEEATILRRYETLQRQERLGSTLAKFGSLKKRRM